MKKTKGEIICLVLLLIIALFIFALNRTYYIEDYCSKAKLDGSFKGVESLKDVVSATDVEKKQAPALVASNGKMLRVYRYVLLCEREQKFFFLF